MKHKHILVTILVLALLLRIIFAIIVPIFEKPDEKAHFEFIEYISTYKKLPVQEVTNPTAEFFQPPFYHFSVSFILSFIKTFTNNVFYQVVLLRLPSVFFSILTLCLIYKISSLIFKNKALNLGILAFAAFLPSHANFNSNVTNANFADFLSTLILYLLLVILIKGENYKKILLLGLIAGISLITRLSIIPVIIAIPFAFIVKYYPDIKKAIKPVALIAIIALLISSWLFVRNINLYGDFLGVNAMNRASPPDIIKFDLSFIARLLGWTFVTFWASFGRTNNVFIGNLTSQVGIVIFIITHLILLLITLSSIYGLYIFYKKYKENKNILNNNQKKSFLILIFYLTVLSFSFVSFNIYDFQPQGRLFFPAISAISIFFTLGIYNLFEFYNRNRLFLPVYVIFLLLINLASIINIVHYY
jgi:4-amino-4-deoxy-L-arabinose transferase-like glycosyltransferase